MATVGRAANPTLYVRGGPRAAARAARESFLSVWPREKYDDSRVFLSFTEILPL
jgi:hypothetical protein